MGSSNDKERISVEEEGSPVWLPTTTKFVPFEGVVVAFVVFNDILEESDAPFSPVVMVVENLSMSMAAVALCALVVLQQGPWSCRRK